MAGPQLAPFYLHRCPLHSCQVDRIEKCPSTKSAACGLRNPYPVSVWCNLVTPCIYFLNKRPLDKEIDCSFLKPDRNPFALARRENQAALVFALSLYMGIRRMKKFNITIQLTHTGFGQRASQ